MDNPKTQLSARLDSLKTGIRDKLATRRPLTKQIQEERTKKNERSNFWTKEVKSNWFIYFLLGVSALFTGMLGLFMGLAPHLTPSTTTPGQMDITFNTDFGHVFTAFLYIVSFITITEGAFVVGKWKYHTREENNGWQAGMMILVIVLAFCSILGTGIAGGSVVASTLGFLSEFREIPAWAQDWAVRVIPILFAFYAVFFTVYWLSSNSAQMERIAKQEEESITQDHEFTMRMLELTLKEEVLVAEADALTELVRRGKLSTAEWEAARRARMSILQLEEFLGRDLNDDNKLNNRPILPDPASAQVNTLPWGCEHCGNRNPGKEPACAGCGAPRTDQSPVYVNPLRPAPVASPERENHKAPPTPGAVA